MRLSLKNAACGRAALAGVAVAVAVGNAEVVEAAGGAAWVAWVAAPNEAALAWADHNAPNLNLRHNLKRPVWD